MTRHYLGEWLDGPNHYRMQLQGDAADNPDQRMTEDVKLFIDRTMDIGLGLLNAIVTLVSFVVILWGLSAAAPLQLFGHEFAIPGYLVWGALIYAIFGTVLTQWIGSPLVNLDFEQQQREADFRFNLVRVRENSEQIALMQGEPAERERLMRPLRPRHRQLVRHHEPHQASHLLHPELCAGSGDLSLYPGGAGLLFCRQAATRRHPADGRRLRQASTGRCPSSSRSTAGSPNGAPWSRASTASRCRLQARGTSRRAPPRSALPPAAPRRSSSSSCWCGCRTASRSSPPMR